MRWITKLPWDHIKKITWEMNLDSNLIAALVQTESSGNQNAMRYEPNYKWLFKPDKFAKELEISLATETALQSFSYGLLQIMGGNARAMGFSDYLTNLLDPDLSLKYGCLLVRSLSVKYTNQYDIIAAYNAGSPIKNISGEYKNQAYVDKVLGYLADLKQGGL